MKYSRFSLTYRFHLDQKILWRKLCKNTNAISNYTFSISINYLFISLIYHLTITIAEFGLGCKVNAHYQIYFTLNLN